LPDRNHVASMTYVGRPLASSRCRSREVRR
jgi:hypothetical protein